MRCCRTRMVCTPQTVPTFSAWKMPVLRISSMVKWPPLLAKPSGRRAGVRKYSSPGYASSVTSCISSKSIPNAACAPSDRSHRQNWSDTTVNHMFRDRYVYLAGVAFDNIPKIPTSNSPGATVPFLNTAVLTSRLHSEIYAAFGNANDVLWPFSAANVPGDHMTLWVEANSNTALHGQKRSMSSSHDEAYVAAIKCRRS